MKKIIAVTLLLISITTLLFADDPFNLSTLSNQAKTYAQDQVKPVVEVVGNGLNSGLYAPLSGKLVTIGLQANIVPIKKEGVLTNVSFPVLPLGFLYAGVRIPVVGIDGFVRGMLIPVVGGFVYGGGIGWEPDLVPFITARVLLTYHAIKNIPYIQSINSYGANIIGAFTKIPTITPFVTLGFNRTTLDTDVSIIGGEKLTVSKSLFQMNLGFKLFFLTAEVGVVPLHTISLSAGFSL